MGATTTHLGGVAADGRLHLLRVRLVVGRQGPEPRDHGAGTRHHVHGQLRPADEADASRRSRTPASRRRLPNTAFGTQNKLRMDGGADPDIESYLRFNVAGVADGHGRHRQAEALVDSPTRSTGPRCARPATPGPSRRSTGPTGRRPARPSIDDREAIAANSPVEYNVKPLVSGDGTVSFALLPASSDGLDFASREYADATKRPVLELLVSSADHQAPTAPTGPRRGGDRRPPRRPLVDAPRPTTAASPTTRSTATARCCATTGNVTSFSDTTVNPQTTYQYTVKALDAAGNRSSASNADERHHARGAAHDADVHAGGGRPGRGRHRRRRTSAPRPSCRPAGGVPKRESYLRFQLAGITGPVVEREAAHDVDHGRHEGRSRPVRRGWRLERDRAGLVEPAQPRRHGGATTSPPSRRARWPTTTPRRS